MTVSESILIDEYRALNEKIKKLEAEKEKLRSQIADMMHDSKTNEMFLRDLQGILWKCYYQSKKNKKVNYQLLMEYIGPEAYYDVVGTSESTSLVISKAPKKDQEGNNKTREKPVEDNVITTPVGVIT
ncbi:MAG: hypothetical protein ACOC22_04125 [bacterium]